MRRVVLVSSLAALGLSFAPPAWAQPDPLAAEALGSERHTISGLVDGLARDGIPVEPVLAKVQEGLAKHVPPARITAAVRAVAAHLRVASALATRGSRAERRRSLVTFAEAFESGLTREDVARLRATFSSASASALQIAVEVATELRDRGFGRAAAVGAVEATYRSRGLGGLRRLVSDVASGDLAARTDRDERLLGLSRGRDRDREDRGAAHGWGHGKASGGGR